MLTWELKDRTPMGTKRLQKYAQAHRANSRKLMRVRDRQGQFKLRMLKSLERIKKKL
jgi:hypothetical protein